MILPPVREARKNFKLGPSLKSETTQMYKINRLCAATLYGAILDVSVVQEIFEEGLGVLRPRRGQHIVVHSKNITRQKPIRHVLKCVLN